MTATQRQPGDSGAADDASGDMKAKGMRGVIDVALGVSRATEWNVGISVVYNE